MTIRLYLNKRGVSSLEIKEEVVYGEKKNVGRVGGLKVDGDEVEKYLQFGLNPMDPTAILPKVDRKLVARVTLIDQYSEGFRIDGIYRHKGGVATVVTTHKVHTAFGMNDVATTEDYQTISISAPSIKTLREIYTKVRNASLAPTDDFGSDIGEIQHRRRMAEAKTADAETSH